ncbi:hypothetical protein [Lautropia dentalis]|nr:hypothetical protein [Lautropia dentalis]
MKDAAGAPDAARSSGGTGQPAGVGRARTATAHGTEKQQWRGVAAVERLA